MNSSYCRRTARTTGFTLVELLIVVAILGILAAILFPVFSRVRENARRASCQSNLKQLGLGMTMYMQDFDESPPLAFFRDNFDGLGAHWSSGTNQWTSNSWKYEWMDAVYPYIKSTAIYNCPSDPFKSGGISGNIGYNDKYSINASGYSGWKWGSYRANATDSGPLGRPDNSNRPKLSTYAAPSTTAWVLEGMALQFGGSWVGGGCTGAQNCQSFIGGPAFSAGTSPKPYLRETGKSQELVAWHLDTMNVLFCDGHVKAMAVSGIKKQNASNVYTLFSVQDD